MVRPLYLKIKCFLTDFSQFPLLTSASNKWVPSLPSNLPFVCLFEQLKMFENTQCSEDFVLCSLLDCFVLRALLCSFSHLTCTSVMCPHVYISLVYCLWLCIVQDRDHSLFILHFIFHSPTSGYSGTWKCKAINTLWPGSSLLYPSVKKQDF